MKYKAQLRIPTEMYAYINVDIEAEPEDIVRAYHEFTELVKVKPESKISYKEFAEICVEYLNTGKLVNGGDLEFNPAQKEVLKLITKIVRERDN